jgi:hypothetical protein
MFTFFIESLTFLLDAMISQFACLNIMETQSPHLQLLTELRILQTKILPKIIDGRYGGINLFDILFIQMT